MLHNGLVYVLWRDCGWFGKLAAEGGPVAAEQRENQLGQWRRADGFIR